jgi:hypothetical protein
MLGRVRELVVARPNRTTWITIGAMLLVGVLIRIPQLGHSIAEAYAFRQTQTAFVVRQYAANGIDLAHTPLPVFGPDADVPMEFPLFQAIAAMVTGLGLDASMASRLIGLIAFTGSGALLGTLLLRWHGRVAAIFAVALFEFLPFGVHWGASSLIDFFAVALALLMVVGIDAGFRGNRLWLVVGVVAAIVAVPVKVTTAPGYVLLLLASAWVLIRQLGWAAVWRRLLFGFVAGPGVGLALAIAWTLYGDSIKRGQQITQFLTSSSLRDWNFGTLPQRADPANYLVITGRVAEEFAGPLMIGLLLAVGALFVTRDARRRILLGGLLASAVVPPLVFFNLYVVHSYYLIGIYPVAVAAMAVGAAAWLRAFPAVTLGPRVLLAAAAAVFLLATTALSPQGRADLSQYRQNNPTPALSSLLLDQTSPDDQIVLIGCDWDPTFLYYGERTGVMFRDADAGDFWDHHDIADYGFLFSCRGDLDPAEYLPAGVIAKPLESGGFFQLVH